MKQRIRIGLCTILALALAPLMLFAEGVAPVKNVILLISDGTSLSTLSLARWYQRLQYPEQQRLHIDPYLSGTVLTYCSNAPIGDSAPTTSTYMTGIPSIQGFVSTYPYSAGDADLVPLNPEWAYRPLVTLMQATSLLQNRRIGLVATSEFSHATPADCTASSYKRSAYEWIVPQMVHNGIDVVIAGGATLLTSPMQSYLEGEGYQVYRNDLGSLSTAKGDKVWSLFGPMDIPYDLDAVEGKDPRIDQMTEAAIRLLDQSEEGFFLMVEGSKVDWAAHANDVVGLATDFLAFDRAVQVALDFAKRDGNTAVIVTSDHGNSGFSIGSYRLEDYAGASKDKLFGPLTDIQLTSIGMEQHLYSIPEEEIEAAFEKLCNIQLTPQELEVIKILKKIKGTKGAEKKALQEEARQKGVELIQASRTKGDFSSLSSFIASIYKDRMYVEFTTHGHTGEEVFLATYAPSQEQRLMGFNTNIELHQYLKNLLGLEPTMLELSEVYYAPHSKLFEGMQYEVSGGDAVVDKVLTVKHKGHTLTIKPFTTEVLIDGQAYQLPLSTVYSDKTGEMYLSRSLLEVFKNRD